MLQWNELRITPDGRYLIIDVEVQNLNFYDNIYIESLYFVTYKNPSDYDPISDKGTKIFLWRDYDTVPLPEEHYADVGEEDQHYKRLRKFIDLEGIDNNLFFVHAIANGEAAEDTPCGTKEHELLGVTYNKGLLYKNSIKALSTIDNCTPSKKLIDYILNIKAFNLSLEVGDYQEAIEYWNGLFKSQVKNKTNCGCHGY